MSSALSRDKEFIDKLSKITEENLSNAQFGVNELASKIGMSRSNLHRKVKSAAGVSISKFICQVRLKRATELLQNTSSTISEVAFECGFHSVSYFTKCFHDQYGHPPGHVRKDEFEGSSTEDLQLDNSPVSTGKIRGTIIAAVSVVMIIVLASLLLLILKPFGDRKPDLEKSIAVLPFRNDSPDEEKMYFINSIQAAIIDNLSNIEDLRVIERRSVEKYRNNPKSLAVIAKELNVSYILDADGFKDEDHIRLSIRLIDAKREKRLWSRSYDRKANETFAMVSEIPLLVAGEINAVITPEEKERIEGMPTNSLTALDFYERGLDKLSDWWLNQDLSDLEDAAYLLNKALEYDSTFAKVYARLASIYMGKSYEDGGKGEYEEKLDSSIRIAERALAIDNQCAEAYTHKGWCLIQKGQNELALETLKQGLVYNPNLWETYSHLGRVYTNLDVPDKAIANYYQASLVHRGKHRPYLIREIGTHLAIMGFKDQAEAFLQEFLELTGDSLAYFSGMRRAANHNGDFKEALSYAEKQYAQDTSIWPLYRLAGIQVSCGLYEDAIRNYAKGGFINFDGHFHRLGFAYWQLGFKEEAEFYFNKMIHISNEHIESGYTGAHAYYNIAGVYAFLGDEKKAFEYLRLFNREDPDNIWEVGIFLLTLIQSDPLFDSIRDEPEFQEIVRDVEARYQVRYEKVRIWLEEQGLM